MAQNFLQIPTTAPLPGATLVEDVNNALAGLASLCSGSAEPTQASLGLDSLAGVLWHDTHGNQLKLRNQADTAWIALGTVDESGGLFTPVGSLSYSVQTSSRSLSASDAGKHLLCLPAQLSGQTQSLTLTLPAASALTAGWSVSILAKGGPVVLALSSSADSLNGVTNGGQTLPKGYFAQLALDSSGRYWLAAWPATLSLVAVSAAATVDLGLLDSQTVSISGTAAISSFGATAPAGAVYTLQFSGGQTLTYNATAMILPGGVSIVTALNDCAQFLSQGGGNWLCIDYQRASGLSLASSSVVTQAVRQTALSGAVDSNGCANFLSISGSLIKLAASSVNLAVTYAAGFSQTGAVDYVGQISADVTPWGTPPSAVTISAMTVSGSVVTVTTALAHSLLSGATVTVSGCSPSAYNVSGATVTVLSSTSFSYPLTSPPTVAATTVGAYAVASWPSLALAQTISSLTYSGTTATCVTAAAHNLSSGTLVTVSGASYSAYNGTFAVTVTGSTTFTYTMLSSPAGNASGASYLVQSFLYVDRNGGGAPIYGAVGTAPLYAAAAPSSPVGGQHWYSPATGLMQVWNGSSWAAVQRVFLGEAVMGASGLSGVTTYALGGRYVGPWIPGLPAAATAITASDALGTDQKAAKLELLCITADNGYAAGSIVENPSGLHGSYVSFMMPMQKTRNSLKTVTGASSAFVLANASTGQVVSLTAASWAYRFVACRSL